LISQRHQYSQDSSFSLNQMELLDTHYYLVGMALNMTILFGLRGYIADNSSWPNWLQAFYGSFAYTGFALGLSCLIMPALLGQC
jgi:hypothetical protein